MSREKGVYFRLGQEFLVWRLICCLGGGISARKYRFCLLGELWVVFHGWAGYLVGRSLFSVLYWARTLACGYNDVLQRQLSDVKSDDTKVSIWKCVQWYKYVPTSSKSCFFPNTEQVPNTMDCCTTLSYHTPQCFHLPENRCQVWWTIVQRYDCTFLNVPTRPKIIRRTILRCYHVINLNVSTHPKNYVQHYRSTHPDV